MRDVHSKFGIPNSPQSPSFDQNGDWGISDFRISGQSLRKGNCHNSRKSYHIDRRLCQGTKLDKRKKGTSKKIGETSCRKIVTSLCFFQVAVNLEQSGSRIPDA